MSRLSAVAREGLILSTCNRTEVYAVTGHAGSGAELLLRLLAERAGVPAGSIRGATYTYAHDDAVRHLLRVASGLDSMVLGEDQIQAQLKRAIVAARSAGTLGAVLDRLGAAALGCGKRVRAFTEVGRHAVSLESLALRAVSDRFDTLAGRGVLVLGAGESARLITRHLHGTGARVTILGRRPERAAALAKAIGAASAGLDALPSALAGADVVFCCTSAREPVLTPNLLSGRPVVCVDLGMPRDVDPAVKSLHGVTLVTLDELSLMADAHRAARREHVPAAEAIVARETERFVAWRAARGSAAAIVALRAHAEQVARAEAERALTRLESDSPRDRALIGELANRIVAKLMHAPTQALKTHPESDNIALALSAAFGLPGAAGELDRALPTTPGATDAPSTIEDAAS